MMLDFFWNFLSFVVAIGLLVTIHEYGHFWVARKLGFKVLKFSVGFGPAIVKKQGKDGVEYILAAIPLGGYVKMLDSREDKLSIADKEQDFMNRPVLHRIAVVAAGPIANFLFAIAAFWLTFIIGSEEPRPIVGDVTYESAAYEADFRPQLEFRTINGQATETWQDVQMRFFDALGTEEVKISFVDETGSQLSRTIDLSNLAIDDTRPNIFESVGIKPFVPKIPARITGFAKNSAAEKAGMQAGDEIVEINGQSIDGWRALLETIRATKGEDLSVKVLRNQDIISLTVSPEMVTDNATGEKIPKIGAISQPQYPAEYLITKQYAPLESLGLAISKTGEMTQFIFTTIGKIVSGDVSVHALSGPIGIAEGAGTTARYGVVAFLSFLALLSVNLGLVNLLPVPALDGGHLLYFLVEMVKGSPVSEQVQEFGLRIGFAVILSVMFIAVYNDFLRLLS
ncbi:MAG: RIP metalloprotease RseP [Pseudomonadota bacterium]